MRLLIPLLLAATPALAQHDHASMQHDHASMHHDHAAMQGGTPNAQARAQLAVVAKAAERYRDVRVAQRDGWAPSAIGGEDTPLMGEHWSRKNATEPRAGTPFDPAAFTTLQYAWVNGKRELVGVSYVIRIAPGEALPTGFAGDADHWHVHDVEKAFAAMTEERPVLRALGNWWLDANYRDKGDNRSHLAMVHAWVTVPSPDGAFAMDNVALPYLRAGLPLDWAKAGDYDAANGVNLATPDGCKTALDGRLWIANATRRQHNAVHDECRAQAARMRTAIERRDAANVNSTARDAWSRVQARLTSTLQPQQLARIAALTEHDPMSH